MARGAVSKEQIAAKILETFSGSFRYDKEIRIPVTEDGELVQIKVTLTCAKTNVESGDDTAAPGEKVPSATPAAVFKEVIGTTPAKAPVEPTEEEKQHIAQLVAKLGL